MTAQATRPGLIGMRADDRADEDTTAADDHLAQAVADAAERIEILTLELGNALESLEKANSKIAKLEDEVVQQRDQLSSQGLSPVLKADLRNRLTGLIGVVDDLQRCASNLEMR